MTHSRGVVSITPYPRKVKVLRIWANLFNAVFPTDDLLGAENINFLSLVGLHDFFPAKPAELSQVSRMTFTV